MNAPDDSRGTDSPKMLVLYVPALDRRRLDPDITPFLSRWLAEHPPIELETHPSVELFPTLATGVWPPEHGVWQVRLKPEQPRTAVQRLIDAWPDRWTTAAQCLRHWFDPGFDLPTVEPRRRRRFEMRRLKLQRRAGGGLDVLEFGGRPTVFSAAGGAARHRTVFSSAAVAAGLADWIDGGPRLDFLEYYALDLFCHWNLDRPEAVREKFAETDRLLRGAADKAARLGLATLLVVDHGQEVVRQSVDLFRRLAETGVPRAEYSCFVEITNARFWFFTDRARAKLVLALATLAGTRLLAPAEMARYHAHFDPAEGFGDAYLMCEPGAVFFPHDFYHPLVNAYMARKTPEQAARRRSPVHRGAHGYLPGPPADRGWLVGLTPELKPRTDHGQLIDVAPTILALLGAGIPAGMCGRPLLEWTGVARSLSGAP